LARILVITSGITSIVNSSVAMALRLQKDGHEVSYGSFANIGLTIRSANLTFIKLPNLQNLTENPATDIEVLKSEIARLTTIFDHKKYDLSIIDIECHEFIVSSPNFSEKLVLLSTFLSLWRRPGLIPLHLATHPDTSNPLTRSTFPLIWFRYLASKILRSRISKIKKRGKDRLSYLAKLSSYSEFPWKEKKDETQWLKPVFYKDIAGQ